MEAGIPEREAYDLYHRLVGEVAARNAQRRLGWGDRLRERRRAATLRTSPGIDKSISTTSNRAREACSTNRNAMPIDAAIDKRQAFAI
jgi:hypothetical protein